jgi:hypothetical protein
VRDFRRYCARLASRRGRASPSGLPHAAGVGGAVGSSPPPLCSRSTRRRGAGTRGEARPALGEAEVEAAPSCLGKAKDGAGRSWGRQRTEPGKEMDAAGLRSSAVTSTAVESLI